MEVTLNIGGVEARWNDLHIPSKGDIIATLNGTYIVDKIKYTPITT